MKKLKMSKHFINSKFRDSSFVAHAFLSILIFSDCLYP